MNDHVPKRFAGLAILVVSILLPQRAAAEQADGVRFRGGIAAEGGMFWVVDTNRIPLIGLQGHVGVQINNRVGIYAAPSFDYFVGNLKGINPSAAVLVDYTFGRFTAGIGPHVEYFSASSPFSGTGGGVGARIHLAGYPVLNLGEDHIRRNALVIGIDIKIMIWNMTLTAGERTDSFGGSVVEPMLTIGYQAF